ncbi:hypothetical protein PT276_07685 [Orbaceae bacterium ESL0721]|nr:hypothetical protein [Orbaceae bacterium ESL0721]
MNREYEEILDLIEKIESLLKDNDEQYWSGAFTFFKERFPEDPEGTRVKILSVYGGMGSFNDLVLSKNRVPLIKENNQLDALSEELYIKIKTMRTT